LTGLVDNIKKDVQKNELCVDFGGDNLEIPHKTPIFAQRRPFSAFDPHITPFFAQISQWN
jgi:hypothetical protein